MIPRYKVEYGLADAASAIGGILQDTRSAPVIAGFEEHVSLLTQRGREALYLILTSLGLKQGARVGVPLYVCSVVSKTVLAAGMVPVFLDLDVATYGLSFDHLAHKAKMLDALILVHLFGYPAPVDGAICLMEGKPVIEDCAHGLGSSYKGKPLGSFGNAGFASFGFFKPIGVGAGGCVVTRDRELARRIQDRLEQSPYQTRLEELSHVCRCLFYGTAYRPSVYGITQRFRGAGREEEEGQARISRALGMRRADLAVLCSRISRPTNAEYFREAVPEDCHKWGIPPEPTHGHWNHFIVPFRAESKQACKHIVWTLRKHSIGAGELYPHALDAAERVSYEGDCQAAEEVVGRVFTLPTYAGLSESQQQLQVSALSGVHLDWKEEPQLQAVAS
jgi:dTDP-4-amino-4,6-dideoxygalactose transaminase